MIVSDTTTTACLPKLSCSLLIVFDEFCHPTYILLQLFLVVAMLSNDVLGDIVVSKPDIGRHQYLPFVKHIFILGISTVIILLCPAMIIITSTCQLIATTIGTTSVVSVVSVTITIIVVIDIHTTTSNTTSISSSIVRHSDDDDGDDGDDGDSDSDSNSDDDGDN